jgi:hypothetical protein
MVEIEFDHDVARGMGHGAWHATKIAGLRLDCALRMCALDPSMQL